MTLTDSHQPKTVGAATKPAVFVDGALLLAMSVGGGLAMLDGASRSLLGEGYARDLATVFGFMAVATFYFNWRLGYFWTSRGLEMPLLLLVISAVILIRGGGEYSVDRRIGREV